MTQYRVTTIYSLVWLEVTIKVLCGVVATVTASIDSTYDAKISKFKL